MCTIQKIIDVMNLGRWRCYSKDKFSKRIEFLEW